MDWSALYKALGLCLVSILIEAVSYTKTGKTWLEKLNQPKYSLSLRAWYFVGAIYYLLFGTIAYRIFNNLANPEIPTTLVILIMVLNGAGNFILFKFRSTKWFYLIIYPFGLILLTFIIVLLPNDSISAGLASVYFAWLIYDLYFAYGLWKLNDNKPGESD